MDYDKYLCERKTKIVRVEFDEKVKTKIGKIIKKVKNWVKK